MPKQFKKLNNNSNFSLLQETIKRLERLKNVTEPVIICNKEHRFLVAEQCKEINVTPKAIILEPIGKNTAPAILLAALRVSEENEHNNLLVLSSDHILKNEEQFCMAVESSIEYSNNGKIILFGVIPNRAETGYGYIEVNNKPDLKELVPQNIKNFVEKPNIDLANKFLKDGRYLWNSGIFMFTAFTLIKEMKKYSKEVYEKVKKSYENKSRDLDFIRIEENHFKDCKSISIDNAIMEKTKLAVVFPLDDGWSDIGNWLSVWENSEKDKDNNSILGNVYSKENKNCYIRSENRMLVALGLDNLVVIETEDVVFVGDIKKSQEIKSLVDDLRSRKIRETDSNLQVFRPWGDYKTMIEGYRWLVKLITVKPGASLSLQMHHHRAEHWIVVKGTAEIELEGVKKILGENQSIHIPLGSKHRLSNPGKLSLELIEVQSGAYLDEDDIIRFKDNYNRS